MSIVNPETFEPTGPLDVTEYATYQEGTVEVTLGRITKRVVAMKCMSNKDGHGSVTARGMTGRYWTGRKAWPAYVRHYIHTGREHVNFGRDDRNPKFNKANALYFAAD